MAKGSGLRTAIKIIKAADRANNQRIRNNEKLRKQQEREEEKRLREQERELAKTMRQQERESAAHQKAVDAAAKKALALQNKAILAAEKQSFKDALNGARQSYENRCEDRKVLREQIVDMELK